VVAAGVVVVAAGVVVVAGVIVVWVATVGTLVVGLAGVLAPSAEVEGVTEL
jgi:hypothetical protein